MIKLLNFEDIVFVKDQIEFPLAEIAISATHLAELKELSGLDFQWIDEDENGLGPVKATLFESEGEYYFFEAFEMRPEFIALSTILTPNIVYNGKPDRTKLNNVLQELNLHTRVVWKNDWLYLSRDDKIDKEIHELLEHHYQDSEIVRNLSRRYFLEEALAYKRIAQIKDPVGTYLASQKSAE